MALDFVAGCIGGCAGVIVGHPLDTIKVHLQNENSRNPRYNGMIHCFKSLVAKEGIRGVYKGMSSPVLGVAAINAIVFGVQGNTQRRLKNPNSLTSHGIAGATAGLFQCFICSPVELAKSRLQVAESSQGLMNCIKSIYSKEGYKGIFKGLNITIVREVPAFAIYFLSYEWLTQTHDNRPISTSKMLMSGGCAGTLSWFFIYPIDVIKTRLQLDGFQSTPKYLNAYDCYKKSVATEGYGLLVRGLTPTVIRAFPVNAAIFTVVAWTIRWLDSFHVENTLIKDSKNLIQNYVDTIQHSESSPNPI